MFLSSVEFDGMTAFLNGYDIAQSGGFLVGFREWLIVQANGDSNLAWSALVLRVLEKRHGLPQSDKAIDGLFDLLEEFIAIRDLHEGLRQIYVKYEGWLRRQEWYTPKHPAWLSDALPLRARIPRKKPRRKRREAK